MNATRPYAHYYKKIKDGPFLQPGEAGNCTDNAFTTVLLEHAGIKSWVMPCQRSGYTYVVTEDWQQLTNGLSCD